MNVLEKAEKEIVESGFSPARAADLKIRLAAEYSYYMGRLEDILARRPLIWMELRKSQKSDKATDRAWEATQDGIDELVCRSRLKRIEKLISSLSTYVRVAENEARNLM